MGIMSTVTRIKCKTDNCYLVTNGKDAFLVDTGSAIGYDQVLAECSKYNMKLIVLTHTHFDHAENAAKLSKHFNIPVACHEADVELFESYDKQPMESYGIVGKVVLDTSLKVLRETPVEKPENLILIKDGDDLSAYGFDAKIIGLPGHTKGSIGVDVEGKHLIVGDELDNWISPATGHLYNDLDAIKKSADKITALGERTIYYGHGKPTKNKFKKI
jgi:glyoxylase-like metal-dependent hydrolase (beta-lactamase superfamily II)